MDRISEVKLWSGWSFISIFQFFIWILWISGTLGRLFFVKKSRPVLKDCVTNNVGVLFCVQTFCICFPLQAGRQVPLMNYALKREALWNWEWGGGRDRGSVLRSPMASYC